MPPTNLSRLIEMAKKAQPTSDERDRQRRSFVYGNTSFENPKITTEMVDQQADALANASKKARKVG